MRLVLQDHMKNTKKGYDGGEFWRMRMETRKQEHGSLTTSQHEDLEHVNEDIDDMQVEVNWSPDVFVVGVSLDQVIRIEY